MLLFLKDIKERVQPNHERTPSQFLLSTAPLVRVESEERSWKFKNLSKEVVDTVTIGKYTDMEQLSEIALERKGMAGYLKNMGEEMRHSRVLYGFVKKRSEQAKIKFNQDRWMFLISSRPLVSPS